MESFAIIHQREGCPDSPIYLAAGGDLKVHQAWVELCETTGQEGYEPIAHWRLDLDRPLVDLDRLGTEQNGLQDDHH